MAKGKTISLTGDHVFMPVNLMEPKWAESQNTQSYPAKDESGKRQKYTVNDGLADFLIERDQAMEVPPDVAA